LSFQLFSTFLQIGLAFCGKSRKEGEQQQEIPMTQSIETQVAAQLAHQDDIAQKLARTGGEIIHPDHYDLREAIRNAVLEAIDGVTEDKPRVWRMSDAELPALFKTLDAISQRMFLKGAGV
jgi:hypothetical protein